MPLIILSGYPSSGKSKRAKELKEYFEAQGKEVHVVDEYEQIARAGFEKNSYYKDSRKEKDIRSVLKSEVVRLISPNNVVIFDGSNYIKGYRYELYCATKANHSTQCTMYTLINKDDAWAYNEVREKQEKYDRDVFDGLIFRFEEPEGRNRWDAPLFCVMNEDNLNLKAISECLFDKKAPPPNMSTQNPPLNPTNYLFDMNKITRNITTSIMAQIKLGCKGEMPVPGYEHLQVDLTKATVPKLISLNKQYLTYSKMHSPEIDKVPQLYIQYLRSNLT